MRRPVIAITGNFGANGCELAEAYYLSVSHAEAVAFVVPPIINLADDAIESILDSVDGLLLSGGADINPLLLGEEPLPTLHGINQRRDDLELRLARRAFERNMPILGICRGIQVLAAALGGTVLQDIESCKHQLQTTDGEPHTLLKHSQDAERWCATHSIKICDDTLLHSLFATSRLAVNSFHHQAVGQVGPHLRIAALARDGVIEAVESNCGEQVLGVQWHPESFELVGDHTMMPLFEWLTRQATLYRKTVNLHRRIVTLDSHEDTPMFFDQGIDFGTRDKRILVNLPNMRDGMLDCGIQAAYQAQGSLDDESLRQATMRADALLDGIEDMVQPLADSIRVVTDLSQGIEQSIRTNKAAGRHTILLAIENGYAFGRDITNIQRFHQRGVVYTTLCHNGHNQICASARPKPGQEEMSGLTSFGREVVEEMNRVGMAIDLSHAAESTFYEVLALSSHPVVCSHSNARALCNHPRNLSDDQLRALAAHGGVAQVTLYNGFLVEEGQATIDDVVRHLEYMIGIMGIDHVGIGTDLDGDGGVPGLANAAQLPNLTRRLIERGYSDEDIAKIWGGNFMRVLEANIQTR